MPHYKICLKSDCVCVCMHVCMHVCHGMYVCGDCETLGGARPLLLLWDRRLELGFTWKHIYSNFITGAPYNARVSTFYSSLRQPLAPQSLQFLPTCLFRILHIKHGLWNSRNHLKYYMVTLNANTFLGLWDGVGVSLAYGC